MTPCVISSKKHMLQTVTRNRVSRRQYAGFLSGSIIGLSVATGQTTATDETVSIRHSRSSRSRGLTTSSSGPNSARESINITPDDGTDRIEFGGDTDRVFALIDDDTGQEVIFKPDADADTASSDRIRFRVTPREFEKADPLITAFTPDREDTVTEIAGSYSGDLDMVSSASIHAITVELRQTDGSVLSTTDPRFVATGYEYTSSIEDTTLRITRSSAVDPDWTTEFTLSDDGTSVATVDVANNSTDDTFAIDLSAIDVPSGDYSWSLDISAEANEPAKAAVVTLRGGPIDPTDPTPDTVTLTGQLSGAFDPDVGAVRAYAGVEVTTRPNAEGTFSLSVPLDETFSLAYIEIDPETETKIVENGLPDIHLLTRITDPRAQEELGTFTIPEASQLDVTITDATGDPAEDVRTWVQSYDPDTGAWVGLFTSTDADGRFQFRDNDPGIEMGGPVRIAVEPNDEDARIPDVPPFETLDVTQPESVTLQLDPVTVSGQIEAGDLSETGMYALPDGPYAYFWSSFVSDTGDYEFTIQRNQRATLGAYQVDSADNTFVVRNDLADVYAVETITPQSPTTVDTTSIPNGDVLEIRVEDGSGDPIPESIVAIRHNRNDATVPLIQPVDDNGEFRVGEASAGIELTGDIDVEVTGLPHTEFADATATESLTISDSQSITITLGDSETPTVADYAGPDGVVRASGLQDAFADWTADDIPVAVLQSVFSAWQSGDPVNTGAALETTDLSQQQLNPTQPGPSAVDSDTPFAERSEDTDGGSL